MKNFGEFFNNQIENAKSIFLSHTDGMDEEKLHECIRMIKDKNPATRTAALVPGEIMKL